MSGRSEPPEYADSNIAQIRETIARLQSPIQDVNTLLGLLVAPLHSLGLISPQYLTFNVSPLSASSSTVLKHIPLLQRALLEHVIPTWEPMLVEQRAYDIVEQYFCPDSFSFASPAAGEVVLHAYSVILSLPLTDYSIHFLARLAKAYPIDVLRSTAFSGSTRTGGHRHAINWEDCVKNIAAVPSRVANVLGDRRISVPPELEYSTYFNNVSIRCEHLIHSLSLKHSQVDDVRSVAYLLTKLVNVGVFAPSVPTSPAQPSFFQATLRNIHMHISTPGYSEIWAELLSNMSSTLALNNVLTSFVSHLSPPEDLDASDRTRAAVKMQALLLQRVFGRLEKERGELWDAVRAVALGRVWTVGHARMFACWIAGAEKDQHDTQALETMLNHVVESWTTPDHIKHSLLKHHQYLTAFLLLILSYLPTSPTIPGAVNTLALSPPFITAISTYIGHLDPSVRRCGMLVAEEVADRAGKKLDFGSWDGEQDGKAWCRNIRELLKGFDSTADVEVEADSDDEDAENMAADDLSPNSTSQDPQKYHPTSTSRKPTIETMYDSDDSLTGYQSSPASSRSSSPTPSELGEIEKDPTLRVGHKKVMRPVYLAQLGEMIRPTSGLKSDNEEGEVMRIEVALNTAEELIRRKRSYGTELEENAANLAYGFVGLQDNYDLEGFAQKRQAALNALVACCPRKAAPAIIEEFFKNQYSTDQRYAILNALALGARELASLPIPETPALQSAMSERISFPSKRLPPALHAKYITAGDRSTALQPVQNLLEGISRNAIDKTKDDATDKVPELVRERQLRIRGSAKITEATTGDSSLAQLQSSQMTAKPAMTFTEVAAECFIHPLINRFWLFLRDEQTREARTANQSALHRYRSTGTGLILNAMVLSHFLAMLAVLVHAARNAKEWLAVIAPDALELAVAVGTRRLSQQDDDDDDGDKGSEGGKAGKEAAVLTTSLEVVLVVLDGCVDLDGGRSLSLDHTAMVLGAGAWAGEVLTQLEKGAKVPGGGGMQEAKLRGAAAGVVLKVEEVTSRWRRSMVDVV